MAIVEMAATAVGKATANQVVRIWLAHRSAADSSKDLPDLIRVSLRDRIHRRRLDRQIEDIADGVVQRLEPLCRAEYADLAENDKAAVLLGVAETLTSAHLDDSAIFEADVRPANLVRILKDRLGELPQRDQLGDSGRRLFDVVLTEALEDFVHLVIGLSEFVPRASQELLSRLSDIGGEMNRLLWRLPVRTIDAPTGADFDEDFRREYLGVISRTLDELELFGIDTQNFKPRTTLSVAYISLTVSQDVNLDESEPVAQGNRLSEWRQGDEPETGTVRVEKALGDNHRLLLRGEAGSGKTTLLRWLAITAARGKFGGPLMSWNGCVPFFVKLRSYAGQNLPEPSQFLDEVASSIAGHMPEAWVDRQLRSGRALLLVDGLDELAEAQRPRVRRWLRQLLAGYGRIRVVVTSRPGAASADWLVAEDFSSASLKRMTPSDIRSFIGQWHDAVRDYGSAPSYAERLVRYEAALIGRLEGSSHIRSLATNPLLCAMLCALNLDRRTQLPRSRMGIYDAALKLLLHRRDAMREITSVQRISLEDTDKIILLRDLAWRLAVYNKSEVSRADALDWVAKRLETMPHIRESAGEVLDHLLHRCGILREPAYEKIDFVHRTFQEYLAALEAAEQDHVSLLVARAHLDLWRGTVVMAAGHANEPVRRKLITGLLERADAKTRLRRRLRLIAVSCMETMASVPADILQQVESRIEELVPPRGKNEVASLASAGDHVLRRLPASLNDLSEAAAAATVATAALINGPDAMKVLARFGADRRHGVVDELLTGWEYFEPDEYARQVLARSPLKDGVLTVDSLRLAEASRHLTHLTSLTVDVKDARRLKAVKELPHLHGLWIRESPPDVDLIDCVRFPDLRTLVVNGPVLSSPEGVRVIGQLKQLTRLHLRSPGNDWRNLDFLPLGGALTQLSLTPLNRVEDYSAIKAVDWEELALGWAPGLRDLSELGASPSLTHLVLTHCAVGNFDPLPEMFPALESLTVRYSSGLSDLGWISRLPRLRRLDIEGCENVTDLGPVDRLDELWAIDARGCRRLRSVEPLARCRMLHSAYLNGTRPGLDLSPLHDRPIGVYVEPEQVVHGEPTKEAAMTLNRVNLGYFADW